MKNCPRYARIVIGVALRHQEMVRTIHETGGKTTRRLIYRMERHTDTSIRANKMAESLVIAIRYCPN